MTINKFRNILYKTARIAGDINAVKRGSILQRIFRRILGRFTGRMMGKMSRKCF